MRKRINPPTPKPPIIRALGEDPKRERNMAARRKKAVRVTAAPEPEPVPEQPRVVGRTYEEFQAAHEGERCGSCDWFEPQGSHGGVRTRGSCLRHPAPLSTMSGRCCSEHVPIP